MVNMVISAGAVLPDRTELVRGGIVKLVRPPENPFDNRARSNKDTRAVQINIDNQLVHVWDRTENSKVSTMEALAKSSKGVRASGAAVMAIYAVVVAPTVIYRHKRSALKFAQSTLITLPNVNNIPVGYFTTEPKRVNNLSSSWKMVGENTRWWSNLDIETIPLEIVRLPLHSPVTVCVTKDFVTMRFWATLPNRSVDLIIREAL